jgi:peptide deformylase
MKLPDLEKLRIVHYPDPVLKQVCAPVEEFGDHLQALARRMRALMGEAGGAGLAAPQVGVPIRLFVRSLGTEEGRKSICVNPRFIELSGAEEKEEGCLSIPQVTVIMRRATHAVMEAFDFNGNAFTETGVDLEARMWQHELDHLAGTLITDNMSATDEIANRRAVKQLEAEYSASSRR